MYGAEKIRVLFSNANYIMVFPESDKRNLKHVFRNKGISRNKANPLLNLAFETGNYAYFLDNT